MTSLVALRDGPEHPSLPGIEAPAVTISPAKAIPFADLESGYLERTISGALAHAVRSGEFPHVSVGGIWRKDRGHIDLDTLRPHLPTGADIERSVEQQGQRDVFVRGDDFVLRIETSPDSVLAEVASATPERSEAILCRLRERLEIVSPIDKVSCRSWTREGGSMRFEAEKVSWRAIDANYPSTTREQLNRLLALGPGSHRAGRLILFTGPPGTGKTWALRALMTQWAPWCAAEIIVDPDYVFYDASYLQQLLSREPRSGRARLFVCEDVDALLTDRHCGGLERLLNLTDGVLGQGREHFVLLTSNVRQSQMLPALIRPGRCLARVEFGSFSVEEARTRLAGPVSGSKTLAEIYEAEGLRQIRSEDVDCPIGAYL